MLVVDASVAAKWFFSEREQHQAEAVALLSMHLSGAVLLMAPDHLRLEMRTLPGAMGRRRTIRRVAATLDGLRLNGAELTVCFARATARLVARHQISPYDACYCALAKALDTELVTGDRRLAASGACRFRLLEDWGVTGRE